MYITPMQPGTSPDKFGRELKAKATFSLGLRFEIFYALQVLTDQKSRIHASWRRRAQSQVSRKFHAAFKSIGACVSIWPAIADALRTQPADIGITEILAVLRKQPAQTFQREILEGLIHYREIVEKLVRGKSTLQETLGKIPKRKREWLAFMGLYPYLENSPLVVAIETLLQSPNGFKKTVIWLTSEFWESSFKETWTQLQEAFRRSMDEKYRLFETCTFSEFTKQVLLRIEVNEKRGLIQAARGGYQLPFSEIKSINFMPSSFNDKRHWSAYEEGNQTVVYFPYFDPVITPEVFSHASHRSVVQPELDPALIFKALGDTTRYAMVSILAKSPKTSVELSRALSISKPTVSHHVHILRDAGLIQEAYANGSVTLSVRQDVLENLSHITVRQLFEAKETKAHTIRRKKS